MARSQQLRSLELRSKATSSGELELWLDDFNVPDPEAGQVVVRIEERRVSATARVLDRETDRELWVQVAAIAERKYEWGDGLPVEITPRP